MCLQAASNANDPQKRPDEKVLCPACGENWFFPGNPPVATRCPACEMEWAETIMGDQLMPWDDFADVGQYEGDW